MTNHAAASWGFVWAAFDEVRSRIGAFEALHALERGGHLHRCDCSIELRSARSARQAGLSNPRRWLFEMLTSAAKIEPCWN